MMDSLHPVQASSPGLCQCSRDHPLVASDVSYIGLLRTNYRGTPRAATKSNTFWY